MWSHGILGTDVYHIVQWFFVYSIIGWFVESAYMSIYSRKIINRGFIRGPICPIYGVGALTVFFLLKPFAGRYMMLYILGAVLATAIEYLTARLMIRVFGSVWWDYQDKPWNYKGVLCLESTLAWGFYTVFLFLFLQGFVEKIVESYQRGFGIILGGILIVYYMIEFLHVTLKEKWENLPNPMIAFRTINIRRKY